MKSPCMVVVQYILPALRMEIARALVKEHGLRKTEVAEKMALTPAAVTQYLNLSRGERASTAIERSGRVMALVTEMARDLAEGVVPANRILMKLCQACNAVRAEGVICDLHMEAMPRLREIETCACSLGLVAWGEETPKPS